MPHAAFINEDTYPIAVACLAAGFATIPKEKVFGNILVINHLEAVELEGEGERPYLIVTNSWMSEEVFDERYTWIPEPHNTPFRRAEQL